MLDSGGSVGGWSVAGGHTHNLVAPLIGVTLREKGNNR